MKKILIGIFVFLVVIGGFLFVVSKIDGTDQNKVTANSVGSFVNDAGQGQGENMDEYRSSDMPEECRLPDYSDNVEQWAEHLSHHEETHHCLEYYQ